ncbi:sucrose-phosphatase 2-like isoform X2 [Chenopodium quinoa]|uniref:sucrose-phosphatase 2-like isoform X2 n=1 Tax=Chenopodium quinoa TaxID=63459 RepID=UPI000B796800|nr:sucrose-phosphatase 2-like isoform X2 [Chenopodium quinoa]
MLRNNQESFCYSQCLRNFLAFYSEDREIQAPHKTDLLISWNYTGHGTMDRLDNAARVMLVSDLDYTMVDHDDSKNNALLRFNALWEAYFRHDSLLVFSTGRSPISYKESRNEKPLLTPDITVMSVGTEIAYGDSFVPDVDWEQSLNHKWDRKIVTEETDKFSELVLQSETEQRPHKVSFFVDKAKASKVIEVLEARLVERGLDIKIIYSGGVALDVLPRGAGKGQALTYLMKKFDGKNPRNTLVCGDSGNDAELFSVQGVYGVMVSNEQEELLQWHALNAKNNQNILLSSERCAAGIIQAIAHFDLGPCISPRDEMDSLEYSKQYMNPGYEVVNMYLACEKWQRGEVDKSEKFIQNLKSKFHSSGVFVHASGVEKPLCNCLDSLEKSYGHMQGRRFTRVDRVSSAQIGSDTWLVKFDKWESSVEITRIFAVVINFAMVSLGKECRCCLTTVLLNLKSEGFTWMHVHQTWMNGTTFETEREWLF